MITYFDTSHNQKRGIGKMLMQVQQSALAPMAVVASDATDNQTSNTSGTSPINTTVNVHT